MKKHFIFILVTVLIVTGLCACGANGATVELNETAETSDGNFTFSMPESWNLYDKPPQQDMVLSITNNDGAFTDVFFYSNETFDYPADVCLQDLKNYYGENIIGSVEEITIADMKAYRFLYAHDDLGEDGDQYNYHGYEYVIDTPYGVMDVNTYYGKSVIEGKIFDPSKDELKLLERIVESIQVN